LDEKVDAVALGAMLLTHGGGDKVDELYRVTDVDRSTVEARVCEIVAALPVDALLPCIRQNAAHWGGNLPSALLQRVAMRQERGSFLVLVSTCWADGVKRCAVFIEYGLVMEAFTAAMAYHVKEFLPLIAYRASLMGRLDVVKNCERILT
jgi:hypothetical protein